MLVIHFQWEKLFVASVWAYALGNNDIFQFSGTRGIKMM